MDHEDRLLASAASSRESAEILLPVVNPQRFQHEMSREVWSQIDAYYVAVPTAGGVDWDVIREIMVLAHPKLEKDLTAYIARLRSAVVCEPAALLHLYRVIEREAVGDQIQIALTRNRPEQTRILMERWIETGEQEDEDETYHASPLDALFSSTLGDRIPIAPTRLNDRLGGGLPRQSQVCVFARPNVGKSTYCANLTGQLLRKGYRVLYFGNEDNSATMVSRVVARLTDRTIADVVDNPKRAYAEAMEVGLDRYWFWPLSPGSPSEIRAAVSKHRPDVYVVDQIYGMALASREGAVQAFAQICQQCRSISKDFNAISVLVTQAGESAAHENHVELVATDVEWSNTGVVAQMDLMIGLGQNSGMRLHGKALISVPKWKYGPDIMPFEIGLDYERQRILA